MPSILTLTGLCLPIALATNMAAQSFEALVGLDKRQFRICSTVDIAPADTFCARSCGAGYVQCASFPNCYNPGAGDICCSDGWHCDASEGPDCCSARGSTVTVLIPGTTTLALGSSTLTLPGSTITSVSTTATTITESFASTSSAVVSTTDITTIESTVTLQSSTSIDVSSIPSYGNASTTATQPSAPTSSPSWYPPPQQTTNAGMKGEVVGWLLGGFSALGLGFLL